VLHLLTPGQTRFWRQITELLPGCKHKRRGE